MRIVSVHGASRMKARDIAARLGLAAGSAVLGLLALEFGLRLTQERVPAGPVCRPDPLPDACPLHIPVDAPCLYALNPDHPEISSQGLRDREFDVPKPPGVFRILVLGDSVTYGVGVRPDETFPKRLESILNATNRTRVEVLNAGVSGYTAYNEWQFFRRRGREFEPDLVIAALCLNDVVDPQLHWNYTRQAVANIPGEAIPNPDYHLRHILPMLRARARLAEIARGTANGDFPASSRLYQWLVRHVSRAEARPDVDAAVPTFITGEDSIGIEVLMDENSPETQWLMGIYARLHADVTAAGARLCTVILPLAYQLDDGYPFVPQPGLALGLERRGIPCLDLLPAFRRQASKALYPPARPGRGRRIDVWHLTDAGHRAAAEAIAARLRERGIP